MAANDYLLTHQSVRASCLIEAKDIDSFYNPVTQSHTGYAWDGQLYTAGEPQGAYASWYTEGFGPYRGELQTFPQIGLIVLSRVAMTIFDGTNPALNMWMQFLLQNNYALADNFNGALNGWLTTGVVYANGIVSVINTPDYGNFSGQTADDSTFNVNSNMVNHLDFTRDSVYLDFVVYDPILSDGNYGGGGGIQG